MLLLVFKFITDQKHKKLQMTAANVTLLEWVAHICSVAYISMLFSLHQNSPLHVTIVQSENTVWIFDGGESVLCAVCDEWRWRRSQQLTVCDVWSGFAKHMMHYFIDP